MKKKLLYISSDSGRTKNHRLPIMLELEKQGYELHISLPDVPDYIKEYQNICWHETQFNSNGRTPADLIVTFFKFIRLFWKVRPDALFLDGIKTVLLGSIVARFFNVKVVASLFSGLGLLFISNDKKIAWMQKITRMGLRFGLKGRGKIALFQNSDDLELLIKLHIITADQGGVIDGSGIDIKKYAFSENRDKSHAHVYFISRLLKAKGVVDYLKAAAHVKEKYPDRAFTFHLVGDVVLGNPDSMLLSDVEKYCELAGIAWEGHSNNIAELLQSADIVCLPSLREGVPRILIEAAACGCVVVTTDAPGCREVVKHEVSGLVVPIQDIDRLTQAIEAVLFDPERRTQMGREARHLVESRFALEHIVDSTVKYFIQTAQSIEQVPAETLE